MKKRILMLTLVLMIVLSSFSMVFGATINYITPNTNEHASAQLQYAITDLQNQYDTVIAFVHQNNATQIYVIGYDDSTAQEYLHLAPNGSEYYVTNKTEPGTIASSSFYQIYTQVASYTDPVKYGLYNAFIPSTNIISCNRPIYGLDYVSRLTTGTIQNDWTPPALNVYVKIKAGQQLNLVYDNSVRNQVLKSVDTTDNVILNFWVSKDGKPSSLSAGQVADSWFNRIDINSIPYMPELDEGEMYSIGLFGKSNSGINLPFVEQGEVNEATFEIDITKCQYSVTSTMTGLPIDAGTLDPTVSGPPATNNQIPGLVDMDETKDGISRSDYQEGIVGDIEYQFDRLISFIKLPFTILLSFFVNLGDIIQYALGSVGALTGSLKSLYGILPASIAYLMTFAITITIFKLIFGR